MTVIYKYPLELADEVLVEAPTLARWRTVSMQAGVYGSRHLCVWAEVDPSRPAVGYLFHIYGTGHPMRSTNQHYIGTAFDPIGLVWHVYVESDYQ